MARGHRGFVTGVPIHSRRSLDLCAYGLDVLFARAYGAQQSVHREAMRIACEAHEETMGARSVRRFRVAQLLRVAPANVASFTVLKPIIIATVVTDSFNLDRGGPC